MAPVSWPLPWAKPRRAARNRPGAFALSGPETALATLAGLCGLLFLLWVAALRRIGALRATLENEQSRQKSLSSTYGRITEQWFPLMDTYPYDAQRFRFLGTPVDGVQFEDDRIVFVEFKANRSQLSLMQRRIKRLVADGQVYWEEFRFAADEEDEESSDDDDEDG